MAFQINSPEDERLLVTYTTARNRVRDTVANGVYRYVRMANEAYDTLDAIITDLAAGAGNELELVAYHSALMAPIADETATLRAAAQQLITSIETIETILPGTFGIELPPMPGE